ncbi:uncharacterized protein B0P05DRAFT_559015 [Gilbertella persicaria]|uniref:uncharacterized protein n=1 Tax=Gilbertella persicaria TaxID=101096 RepID=UPI0022211212|nr:uncharacterized protein B0P05DRAFT_559015 [Gilbertella persicaria]KAI8059081.1 hypothetical protein B0P05DRAFT_559015 [Gilbertella persicaria]
MILKRISTVLGLNSDINLFSAYCAASLFIYLELLDQLVVIITEAISNSEYKRFPASNLMVGYTGQSLLVIIVAIIQLSFSVLIIRNLGYVISRSTWKLSLTCICISLASICFRTFSSWFIQDTESVYYIATYNVTSVCVIVGASLWIPFAFCKSDKYIPPSREEGDPRSRITTTNGPRPVYRPNNQESADDELPSYYEMMPPPSYKKALKSLPPTNQSAIIVPIEQTQDESSSTLHRS